MNFDDEDEIIVTKKNYLFLDLLRQSGYPSMRTFSTVSGISMRDICNVVYLTESPFRSVHVKQFRTGRSKYAIAKEKDRAMHGYVGYSRSNKLWLSGVTRIARFLGCNEEEMFPYDFLREESHDFVFLKRLAEHQLSSFKDSGWSEETEDDLAIAMNSLTDTEKLVIEQYYGIGDPPKDLEVIAQILSTSSQYASYIKNIALDKLRKRIKMRRLQCLT